ncbi:CGNR zinc finger domain-containing protein [Streptomyces sp. NPDC087440]|uniref:CGNR zinc finger domain-containing protein n=1 Tax=Streptomyces sp. NPDC087440 TaxID=3365790 RepID=UPI0038275846
MVFDSHVVTRLEHAVALVNALTEGEARGRPYVVPTGAERWAAVEAAVPQDGGSALARVETAGAADRLADTARRMRVVFEAVAAGELDAAADGVNLLLRETSARPRLDRGDAGAWRLHFHGANDSFASGVGASCATALAMVVGGGALVERLGVCTAERCDRVYVDVSRNGARRFCSVGCQNRVKAATFRARRGVG